MRYLIKTNAQSSLFPDLCLGLDLGYTTAVPLILLESPCVSTGETGNKIWALNLFSVPNSEVSMKRLPVFSLRVFPSFWKKKWDCSQQSCTVIKDNLGMTCRLSDCPLCYRRKAIIWPNAGWLVRVKMSEMEVPIEKKSCGGNIAQTGRDSMTLSCSQHWNHGPCVKYCV